ncbi:MAG: SRPBCC domain-containing protein [Anaerolineae bacterium]|nr:SRPBCC domain-containing protein [Anaerolineae bacterium]NUQ06594.1 SRPBCC domain-containing protein [Anaerolineae bacterium]
MAAIIKRLTVRAPIEEVWAALTDPEDVSAWMADSAVTLDLRVGGRYSLFGGETTGIFVEIEAPTILEYTWRQNTWDPAWADSRVRWELSGDRRRTRLLLTHTDFPNDEERSSLEEAWEEYWLEPMIDYLQGDL